MWQTEGWHVIRIWECEIKKVADREERLKSLYNQIVGSKTSYDFEKNPDTIVAESEAGYL